VSGVGREGEERKWWMEMKYITQGMAMRYIIVRFLACIITDFQGFSGGQDCDFDVVIR